MSEFQPISDHVEIRTYEELAELRRQFQEAQIPMMTYVEGNEAAKEAAEDIQRHFNEIASRDIVKTALASSEQQDVAQKEKK